MSAEDPINPIPRATKASTIWTWDFDNNKQQWIAESQCSLSLVDGILQIESTGDDPFMHCAVDLPGGQTVVELRVRSQMNLQGSVFWTTDQSPRRSEGQRSDFQVVGDGKWHEASTRFQAPGQLTDLRIDPGVKPGLVEIDWVRVVHEELHPLTISSVEQRDGNAHFNITNHHDQEIEFECHGRQFSISGGRTLPISKVIKNKHPIERTSISAKCEGWPPVERSIWALNRTAAADWITRPVGLFQLRVARDGSVAQIYRDKQLVAWLGPLVTCDGQIPVLRLSTDDKELKFEGDNISLTIAVLGKELQLSVRSPHTCEGPVVRVIGELQQGILAGLEYLGQNERSSSSLDIETDEHIRFEPDPLKVTMPLMAFVTDRASVALTWSEMSLQPIFATPNFIDGTNDHRCSLRGENISATIRFADDPLDESIAWAAQKIGLPPLPTPPRNSEQQNAICLEALNGPLQTEDGWGHCAQESWPRRPFADMASTIWRLGGQVPVFPSYAFGGGHVPNGTIYFVEGRAHEWLQVQQRQIAGHIARQQPDGSYRYNGKFRRGHFEDTASGLCALPAARLLEFAYITGDQSALQAGIRTLDYMMRFNTPRGAQTWEVPLHTPDQLASAYLVWAYTRGYQLTDKQEYLRQARKWALSGIPFTYIWSRFPIMAYATPPVYGATQWIAPNWMGLPVQWVGGVYAYALTLLAPLDHTLDWNHVARGILVSAQQQQYPDGPHIGLLPDSFNLLYQRRQPADINPCALVSLQMALDGEVDFLDVARTGDTVVAAPFPVTIQNGKAYIEGKAGLKYQAIINGQQVIDIESQGTDIVDLPTVGR